MASPIAEKKVFLLAAARQEKLNWMADQLKKHFNKMTVFNAQDGMVTVAKMQNVRPNVVVAEMDLPKISGLRLVDHILGVRDFDSISVILTGKPPEKEQHLDEIVRGRVQYWTNENDENEFIHCAAKALNYSSHSAEAEYHLRFLAKGDVLMKEGEKADNVYFVKKGTLQASHRAPGQEIVLGNIEVGEFVGEMAYLNGEVRNAHVTAMTDCELIEVPMGFVEKVLYTRPAWSKAMMLTLSKRLKRANTF